MFQHYTFEPKGLIGKIKSRRRLWGLNNMVEIYSRFRTQNGKVLDAWNYGLKAWHFFVTDEDHENYLKKKIFKKTSKK